MSDAYFMQIACGIERKSFDSAVAYAQQLTSNIAAAVHYKADNITVAQHSAKKSAKIVHALSFLDVFFRGKLIN